MRTITIANRKGGVGKSTFTQFVATRLFHVLFKKGKKIALVEFDDQGSLSRSREKELKNKEKILELKNYYPDDFKERLQSLYPIYSWTYETYLSKRIELEKHFDYVFLDFPGVTDTSQKDVIKTIDKTAIPIAADDYDIDSSLSYIKAMGSLGVHTGWFLNRYTNTKFNRYIKEKGHQGFQKVNPNIEMITYVDGPDNGNLMKVNERPEMIRSSRSSVIPFEDKEENIKTLMMYLIK